MTGREVYPHLPRLALKKFYACLPCQTWVGVHVGTEKPFGTMAGPKLRAARSTVHELFDPKWREGPMSRSEAYTWLAYRLGITEEECHIGMFDIDRCNKAIMLLTE